MRVGERRSCGRRALDALGDAGARSAAFSVTLRSLLNRATHAARPSRPVSALRQPPGWLQKSAWACAHLAERRTSVPGVVGGAFVAGVDLATAGAYGFGDAAAFTVAFALRPDFFGRP